MYSDVSISLPNRKPRHNLCFARPTVKQIYITGKQKMQKSSDVQNQEFLPLATRSLACRPPPQPGLLNPRR